MKGKLLSAVLLISILSVNAQQLLLLDRFNGKVLNDSTITVFSSDLGTIELSQYFTIKNNTDRPLALFLRKTVNVMNDSTTDYFCFYIKCWPDTDTTDIADTIQPGAEDYNFVSHVCHIRRFEDRLLPVGLSSITYTIYDNFAFPQPVEAKVTVLYHLSGLGVGDAGKQGSGDAGNLIRVYPNPASDRITIETGEARPGNYTLMIYSSQGTLVQKINLHIQENKLTIDVNHLVSGFYYGRLLSEQGAGLSFRFQVAR